MPSSSLAEPSPKPDVQPLGANKAPQLDCLGCRLTGMAFGVGGGGYVMSQLLKEPPPVGGHRAAILLTAATMFAFGMYRVFA